MSSHTARAWSLIVAGGVLSVVMATFAIATGMYGCGPACALFGTGFWFGLAVMACGIVLRWRGRARDRSGSSGNVDDASPT